MSQHFFFSLENSTEINEENIYNVEGKDQIETNNLIFSCSNLSYQDNFINNDTASDSDQLKSINENLQQERNSNNENLLIKKKRGRPKKFQEQINIKNTKKFNSRTDNHIIKIVRHSLNFVVFFVNYKIAKYHKINGLGKPKVKFGELSSKYKKSPDTKKCSKT